MPKVGRSLLRVVCPPGGHWHPRTCTPEPHTHPGCTLPAPACSVTKRFLNQFAPSFCNILQQIKHPLLGMFSICFMLILIKESETEQTVPSRWPYKCEISKLFYLPQTLLVNFFKLIPASESLPISRRTRGNPGLQIFASVTLPGANNRRGPPLFRLTHPVPQIQLWHSDSPPISPGQGAVPTALGSMARTPTGRSDVQERAPQPSCFQEAAPISTVHAHCQRSHLSLARLPKFAYSPEEQA